MVFLVKVIIDSAQVVDRRMPPNCFKTHSLSSPSLYLNHSNIHHVYMCISQSYHPIVIKNDDPNATKAPRKRPQFRKTPFKVGSRCVLEDGRSGVVKWIGRIDGTGKRSNDPDIGLQLDDAGKLAFYLRMRSHCMHKRGF